MIVSINQPAYLPWLGYFQRIAVSDLHIVLDHVQFEKNSMVNRNKVRTPRDSCMLTVPVKTKGRFGDLALRELEIADDSWRKRHLGTLRANYAKALFFHDYFPAYEELLSSSWSHFSPMVRAVTDMLLQALEIKTPLVYSSELACRSRKSELVLDLCREVGARHYISGMHGRDYLDVEAFAAQGIGVSFQDYKHPSYEQGRSGFEPYMSVIDLLFHHGPESRDILCAGQELQEAVQLAS
jgi:hypothetical protein